MSDVIPLPEPGQALAEFKAGFSDGWNNRPKKSKSAQYVRAYNRGVVLRKEKEK